MGFIPEEKEERKWFYKIGFSMLGGGLVIIFLLFLYLSFSPSISYNTLFSLLLAVVCICIFPFVLGFLYGKWMPFQANKARNLCLKGGLLIEFLLLVPFVAYPKSISFLATSMAVFGLIFYFFILLTPVLFCGLGGYYGAKHREKLSKKR